MRRYTPEQTAARLAYTREWRKRNKDKIAAWELANKTKRNRQRVKLARANREKDRLAWAKSRRRRRDVRRQYSRNYRARMIAKNPNYYRERNREWAKRNPAYASEIHQRRRLRLSVKKFALTLATNRRALELP